MKFYTEVLGKMFKKSLVMHWFQTAPIFRLFGMNFIVFKGIKFEDFIGK